MHSGGSIKLLLFGWAREAYSASYMHIENMNGRTVLELKNYLHSINAFNGKLQGCMIAINYTYATDETVLCNDDEIALIPPVSGG